jgi:hypothetical protein
LASCANGLSENRYFTDLVNKKDLLIGYCVAKKQLLFIDADGADGALSATGVIQA